MTAKIIDGKTTGAKINQQTAAECAMLKEKYNIRPGLAVVLIGDNPASQIYVGMKEKKCQELGFYSQKIVLSKDATMAEVLELIDKLNHDPQINGILVQSPPPPQIDEECVIAAIDPAKDVDCFHAVNVGKMLIGKRDGFFPCTPYGVMVLLEEYNIDPAGKHVVIVGRSNIVGKPLLALMIQKNHGANATVTCVHSRTPDIGNFTRMADIVIVAIGKAEFLTADMIKPGAVVVDVGINRIPDSSCPKGYRICGDVKYDEVAEKAAFITPVPGGVGPMTIAMLMQNTLKGCKAQHNIN